MSALAATSQCRPRRVSFVREVRGVVAYDHAGIIPSGRLEGKRGGAGRVETEIPIAQRRGIFAALALC